MVSLVLGPPLQSYCKIWATVDGRVELTKSGGDSRHGQGYELGKSQVQHRA